MVNNIEFELLLLYVFTFGVTFVLYILIGQLALTKTSVLTDWIYKGLYYPLLFLNWLLIIIIGLDTEFINIEIAIIIVITLTQALLTLRLLTLLWPKIMYDYRLLGIIIVILQMLIDCVTEDKGWLCSSLYSLILPLLLVFLSVPNSDIDLNLNPDIDPELEIPKEVLMIFVTIQLLIFNASDLSGENNDLKSGPLTAVVIIQLLIIIKLTINILKRLLF